MLQTSIYVSPLGEAVSESEERGNRGSVLLRALMGGNLSLEIVQLFYLYLWLTMSHSLQVQSNQMLTGSWLLCEVPHRVLWNQR